MTAAKLNGHCIAVADTALPAWHAALLTTDWTIRNFTWRVGTPHARPLPDSIVWIADALHWVTTRGTGIDSPLTLTLLGPRVVHAHVSTTRLSAGLLTHDFVMLDWATPAVIVDRIKTMMPQLRCIAGVA